MRVIWVLFIIVVALLIKNSFDVIKGTLEAFVDDYTVVSKDAFPCPADVVAEYPGMQGCYYHDLAGCAMFPVTTGLSDCPTSVDNLKSQLASNSNVEVQPANTSIFDYIYDKVKNSASSSSYCPDAQCSFDFFRKMQVMTDAELSAYLDRIKNDNCAVGAICLQPDNLAQYISDAQVEANAQNQNCKDAQKNYAAAVNKSSKQLVQRIYPDCKLASSNDAVK